MSADFKKIAAAEIDEFKAEYRQRFPGRDADELTDEDLLREVMNTVGKPGKLGEHVRCVVSVSMLTEGWDANTVTHILGVRAFGTQLLCEQVVGRGLRRTSYAARTTTGCFEPEYAEVYGVPFSFIPAAGSATTPRAAADADPGAGARRSAPRARSRFPRLVGYRYEVPAERLDRRSFGDEHSLALSTAGRADRDRGAPRSSASTRCTRSTTCEARREQEVAFALASERRRALLPRPALAVPAARRDRRASGSPSASRSRTTPSPQLLAPARAGRATPSSASHRAIVARRARRADGSSPCSDRATTRSARPRRSTSTPPKPVMVTDADEVPRRATSSADTSWEQKLAEPARGAWPRCAPTSRTRASASRSRTRSTASRAHYVPDFIVRVDDGHGEDDLLNLIVEVSGAGPARQGRARSRPRATLWVPGVNNARRASAAGRSSRSPTPGTPRPRSAAHLAARAGAARHEPAQARDEGRGPTPVEAIAAQGHAGEHPHRRAARLRRRRREARRRRCATRATRPSTRSSSGRARTSRTPPTSRCRPSPIYIQEKIDPRALIENLRRTAAAGEAEPELTLFDDFNGLDVRGAGRLLPARAELVEPDDPRRLAAGDDQPRREGGPQGQGPDDLHRPALRHQVRLELAGLHAQARRQGRQGRRTSPASPSRSGRSATPGSSASTPTSRTCATGSPSRASCSPRPAASSSRSATRTCTSCGRVLDEVFGSENFVVAHHRSRRPSGSQRATTCRGTADYHPLVRQGSRPTLKYRQLYRDKEIGGAGAAAYTQVEMPDGARRAMTPASGRRRRAARRARVFRLDNLTSQSTAARRARRTVWFPVELDGASYHARDQGAVEDERGGHGATACGRPGRRSPEQHA